MYAMSVSEMQQAARQHIQHDLYTMARSDFERVHYDTIGDAYKVSKEYTLASVGFKVNAKVDERWRTFDRQQRATLVLFDTTADLSFICD